MLSTRHAILVIGLALLSAPAATADAPLFGRHVTPLLYKMGCSAGACHGAFDGKGAFRLSLFAGQADTDYANVRGGFGRRANPLEPEKSLLLIKPSGAVEHGGGVRLKAGGREYQIIKEW